MTEFLREIEEKLGITIASLNDPIGKGGSADVHVGHKVGNPNDKVAVRIEGPVQPKSAIIEQQQKLFDDLKQSGLDKHPHMLRLVAGPVIVEQILIGHRPVSAWELAEDGTLHDLIAKSGGLDRDETGRLLRPIAGLLTKFRTHSLMHGDVKPQNLFAFDGELKLGDFGLTRSNMGSTHVTVFQPGTPEFMPAESLQDGEGSGKERSPETFDYYGFGMTYVHTRLGRSPFGEYGTADQPESTLMERKSQPDSWDLEGLDEDEIRFVKGLIAVAREDRVRTPLDEQFENLIESHRRKSAKTATAAPRKPNTVETTSWEPRIVLPQHENSGHLPPPMIRRWMSHGMDLYSAEAWEKASDSIRQVGELPRSFQQVLSLHGHTSKVNAVHFSPDGTRLVTASSDKTAKLWDLDSRSCLQTLSGHSRDVTSASFSPDGTRIVTVSSASSAEIWDAITGEAVQTLSGHSGTVMSASFSPDGTRIVTASYDDSAKIWDAESGECLQTLSGHSGTVMSASFSPDGTRIVTGSYDNSPKIWDPKSGECLQTLSGHTSSVNSASFSPDGTRLVTGSSDNSAKIWDAGSGKCLQTLSGHTGTVNSASFSPDGTRLVTGSSDNSAKIWDPKSGECLQTLSGHTSSVNSASFSPDGARLVTGSSDKTIRLFVHPIGAFQAAPISIVDADFTLASQTGDAFTDSDIDFLPSTVYAGEILHLLLTVDNEGEGDLQQVSGIVEVQQPSVCRSFVASAEPVADDEVEEATEPLSNTSAYELEQGAAAKHREYTAMGALLYGRIAAGDGEVLCFEWHLAPCNQPTELDFLISFFNHGMDDPLNVEIPELSEAIEVHPLPRPDFPVTLRCRNDGSGKSRGAGDHPMRIRDVVQLDVTVTNNTDADLDDLYAELTAVDVDRGVRIRNPRSRFEPVPIGASATTSLTFQATTKAVARTNRFELMVHTRSGRTLSLLPFEIDVVAE